MRNLKSILPMLAFVLAIGMSFAFTAMDTSAASGYYEISPGNRVLISNVDCPDGGFDCTIQFINSDGQPQSPEYVVYPNASSTTPLKSNTNKPNLIVVD